MRNAVLIILFSLLIGFVTFNCYMTQEEFEKAHWNEKIQGPIPNFIGSKIETLTVQMLPDSGAYYIYKPNNSREEIVNPGNKLRRLFVLGINVTMAWYRPPIGGCFKPGSPGSTKTFYPLFFLVRLSKPNKAIEEYNFMQIKVINGFPCPYDFTLYKPQYNNLK